MSPDRLNAIIAECLERTIPEAEVSTLDRRANLRDQLDIDSMDMLRFLRALSEATGADIPEADAKNLESLDGAFAYLRAKAGAESR